MWLARLARFTRDCKGGVAPLLALGIIPLVGGVGAAIDYSRASATRAAMQAASDATALMLAKVASTLTGPQLQDSANSFFLANFANHPEASNVTVTATYGQGGTGGFTVTVNSTATVNATFLGVMGYSSIPLSTSGSVKWSNSRLRVALALDNTGSMASAGKMTALKTATHNLLDSLKKAATIDGDVYVSIIPFSKDVNAGAGNYTADWIDWDDWDDVNGTCSYSTYKTKTTCLSHGKIWTGKAHSTWNGCVTDRDQNYDTMNTSPITGAKFPAEQYASCPVQVMGLSYDWTALHSKVDAMAPAGNTNQAIGLAWGWQSLTNAPFTIPAKNSSYKYQEVIILLTDGLNTQNRWTTSQTAIDNREAITCSNIKAAGITLYTVQVNTDGDPTSTLLQQCATDSSKFFLLTSANQIVTTFDQIGTSLQQLYIAN